MFVWCGKTYTGSFKVDTFKNSAHPKDSVRVAQKITCNKTPTNPQHEC